MKRSLLITCFFCLIIIFAACRNDMEDGHTVDKEEPIAYNEYVVADDLDVDSCADMLASNIASFTNQVEIATQYLQTDPQYAYREYHKGTEYLLNVACIIHKYPTFNNIYWIDDIDGFYHAVQNADLSIKEFMDVVNSDINDSEFISLKENVSISIDNISEYLDEISQSSKIMFSSLTENDTVKNTESKTIEHYCEVEGCYEEGTKSIVGYNGTLEYYCYTHYKELEDIINDMLEDTYSSSSFTNKTGTSTTKCAHPGCNNYIASSGDTYYCTAHSKKCGVCGCYIDEDAMYCPTCIIDAFTQ